MPEYSLCVISLLKYKLLQTMTTNYTPHHFHHYTLTTWSLFAYVSVPGVGVSLRDSSSSSSLSPLCSSVFSLLFLYRFIILLFVIAVPTGI